jgi:hypothetical protein
MPSTAGTPTVLQGANNVGRPTTAGMQATATPDVGNTGSRRDVGSNSRDSSQQGLHGRKNSSNKIATA